MNERFEKLVAEAFFDETADASDTKIYKLNDAQMQKFAQLIVGECLDIVANADMTELEGPDPEDVLYVACKQIQEHFGVEE